MSSVNLLTREVALKVVYYGPGLGGKTSSLQYIHRALKADSRGQLVSLATGVDRTLYFDFLPVKLPKLRGFSVRVQLYTVPGQVHYNSTRKLVLTGADGVVFVADSQRDRGAANVESLDNLRDNLREQGLALDRTPLVFQYNKRDAPEVMAAAEMTEKLNPSRSPAFETIATRGIGVFDALKAITTLVLGDLRRKGQLDLRKDPVPEPIAATASQPILRGETSEPITLSSLGEVADAIEKLAPQRASTASGQMAAVRVPSSTARTLSELVGGPHRDQLALVESSLDRGDFVSAVKHAGAAYDDLATRLAGSLASSGPTEASALASLLTAMPASRYLRFREVRFRAGSDGALSSADALFALFFVTDFAMRADELKR